MTMASPSRCIASMARLALASSARPARTLAPRVTLPATIEARRYAGHSKQYYAAQRKKKEENKRAAKKKRRKEFKTPSLKDMQQFSLCDAMRVLRAVEVGKVPSTVKYDLAVRLKTNRHARPVRDRITLPHPVKMSSKIIVFCPDGSKAAEDALSAGAVAAGQESLIPLVKNKKIKFSKVIAHVDSFSAMQKARLGPVLKTLMPSPRTNTVTKDVGRMLREMSSAESYRERYGTVRIPIGQLGFTPQMLAENIKAFMKRVNDDMDALDDENVNTKSLHEVVLSTTHGPGISLTGGFISEDPELKDQHLMHIM